MDDARAYRELLKGVEKDAAKLPWADKRPWRAATHVGEGQVATVDLHDLSTPTARAAVRAVLSRPPEAGAVVFVHGQGRHSDGRGPVLGHVVAEELERACRGTPMVVRPMGPARTAWIADPSKAPGAVKGELALHWRLLFALLAALFAIGLCAGLLDLG